MHFMVIPFLVVLAWLAWMGLKQFAPRPADVAVEREDTKYQVAEFLSPAERSFFGVLQQAVSDRYVLFAKVRLADVVEPVNTLDRSSMQSARNKTQSKHVDFVLCEPKTLAVLGVIELDDASHGRRDRQDRDAFVDTALAQARIPVLHFPARQSYPPTKSPNALNASSGLKALVPQRPFRCRANFYPPLF